MQENENPFGPQPNLDAAPTPEASAPVVDQPVAQPVVDATAQPAIRTILALFRARTRFTAKQTPKQCRYANIFKRAGKHMSAAAHSRPRWSAQRCFP